MEHCSSRSEINKLWPPPPKKDYMKRIIILREWFWFFDPFNKNKNLLYHWESPRRFRSIITSTLIDLQFNFCWQREKGYVCFKIFCLTISAFGKSCGEAFPNTRHIKSAYEMVTLAGCFFPSVPVCWRE